MSWYQENPSTVAHKQFPSVGPITVVAAGDTTIATFDVRLLERLFVEVGVATQALDGFALEGRMHGSGSYHTLYNTAAEFQNPSGLLLGTGDTGAGDGDLTTLAAGDTGWFAMDVRGLESVRLTASAASNSAAVTVRAGGG